MASPFKIPKKKQPSCSDSAPLHSSPLARLQSSAPEFKSYESSGGRADRVHAGNAASGHGTPLFRDVVKTLLGLKHTEANHRGASAANHRAASAANHRGASAANHRGASAANHRAASAANHRGGGGSSQSQSADTSNGWRPKRASDRLLQPPQKKKKEAELRDAAPGSVSAAPGSVSAAPGSVSAAPGSVSAAPESVSAAPESVSVAPESVSVASVDLLAELRGDGHAGSLSPWRRRDAEAAQQKRKSSPSGSSGDDFLSPPRTRTKHAVMSPRAPAAWSGGWMDELKEKERRWNEFRRRKTTNRSAVLRLHPKKPAPTEPIVLSSEEEAEDEGGGEQTTSQSRAAAPGPDRVQVVCHPSAPPPSSLELDFTSLHAGLTHADANGRMMVTGSGVKIPLKGAADGEDGEVTVVASQVRGYGVWDGGVARDGHLLAGWKGPAPSLLFLWVTDAQANLLQRELTAMRTAPATSGPGGAFVLLVLTQQLPELHAALLASFLDMDEYKVSRSPGGPGSPLDWTDGLLLLHSCPPPLDQHLLGLLGHSAGSPAPNHRKSHLNPSAPQQLPTRLIQYPAAPSKGRITVTREDLACLRGGEFLNDVIIDFYLKYLVLEGVGGPVSERSHVFSSFFFKQLSRRRVAGEEDAATVPHTRHQRVKTWTRHVDIFTKDFLFVPVNQEAHWFLVLVCFPGLEDAQYQEFPGASERAAGERASTPQPPICTEQSWNKNTVLKRPCILVMDSLKQSLHHNVCRLLREYLQVEWQLRRGTPRLFSPDSVRSCSCRVPQQDNSSDCGLYLLQFAQSFLQNPVVNFDLPLRLDHWFPRQHVRQKRQEIVALILKMHENNLYF